MLVIGYYLGLRRSEIMQLKWSQVDLDNTIVHLSRRQTKNRTARTAPLYDELLEWMKFAKADRDLHYPTCEWVCHDEGRKILDFRKEWKKSTADAGLAGLTVS